MELLPIILIVSACPFFATARPISTFGLRFYYCRKIPICEPGLTAIGIPCSNYCHDYVSCVPTPTIQSCPRDAAGRQANFNPHTSQCDFDFADCTWFEHTNATYVVDYYAEKVHIGSDGRVSRENNTETQASGHDADKKVSKPEMAEVGSAATEMTEDGKTVTDTEKPAVTVENTEGSTITDTVREKRKAPDVKMEENRGSANLENSSSRGLRLGDSVVMLIISCGLLIGLN